MSIFMGLLETFTALFSYFVQQRLTSAPWWLRLLLVIPVVIAVALAAGLVWFAGAVIAVGVRSIAL